MHTDDSKPQSRLRRIWRQRRSLVLAGCAALTAGLLAATFQLSQTRQAAALAFADPALDASPALPVTFRWGFSLQQFQLLEDELNSGDVLGEILLKQGLTYPDVAKLVENCKGKFNITGMRVGRKLNFLTDTTASAPHYMVYEPSPYEYAVFNLRAPYNVEVVKRTVETRTVATSGVLETSFWQAMTDNGLSDEVADGMIDILSSSVDFYHQRQGDRFKVVYEQHYVEGQPVGTGKIVAALYEREGKEHYAFYFEKAGERCTYFDFDARPARKAFLKSPVKFSRISSRYSKNRLHPILGYTRPHHGTDYAAPHGTSILAVAGGTVLEATRKGGNGNYVKIRHDGTYQTQYLHMSGFAKGIRPGAQVVQGQTIGYVGSTGLATGPHVCFRFWKNGCEVDHLRLNLPQPLPIAGPDFERFKGVRDVLMKQLDAVPYRTHAEIAQEEQAVVQIEPLSGVNP